MGRVVVHARGGILAARRHVGEAAERAGGEMPIGVEHVQVIADDGQVNGVVDRGRDLIAEKIVRRVYEGAVLADEDPDRARLRVQNV